MFPNFPTPPLKKYINLKGLPNKKILCQWHRITIFAFEKQSYLGEFEAEFIKALARESEAQRVLFDEKTEGRNSCDTVPLKDRVKLVKKNNIAVIFSPLIKRQCHKIFDPVFPIKTSVLGPWLKGL
jgi:hypothetical protein